VRAGGKSARSLDLLQLDDLLEQLNRETQAVPDERKKYQYEQTAHGHQECDDESNGAGNRTPN
jgi:hypothetical protein